MRAATLTRILYPINATFYTCVELLLHLDAPGALINTAGLVT